MINYRRGRAGRSAKQRRNGTLLSIREYQQCYCHRCYPLSLLPLLLLLRYIKLVQLLRQLIFILKRSLRRRPCFLWFESNIMMYTCCYSAGSVYVCTRAATSPAVTRIHTHRHYTEYIKEHYRRACSCGISHAHVFFICMYGWGTGGTWIIKECIYKRKRVPSVCLSVCRVYIIEGVHAYERFNIHSYTRAHDSRSCAYV